MQTLVDALRLLYLFAGLANLVAVTAILYRLRFGLAAVLAPGVVTIGLVLVFQALGAASTGLPFFVFGLYASAIPALTLVTPVCIVLIALSSRLSTGTRAEPAPERANGSPGL